MTSPIDLRSDTVTKPTEAMRRAMADADVGDDVYGEDPTARALEERAAALLGKEASLFVPSGTMANQLALLLHCRPGDEVICGEGAHVMFYESGAGAAWAGVQFAVAGRGGRFDVADMQACVQPVTDWSPRTRLVAFENTHNRSGGLVWDGARAAEVAAHARALGYATHLDGARIWNAAVATGASVAELARVGDTVSACFSKGLGAPVGSVLAGPRELVVRARRLRKMLGGGMRQVGILCAAALHALDHHVARLGEDHRHARRLAERLTESSHVRCDLAATETNIVVFDVPDAQAVVTRAKERGVLVSAIAKDRIRAVTHLGVTGADVERAADVLLASAAP